MSIQSIILLVVVVLVLMIDKLFTKNDKQVAEKLIEANKDNTPKDFFSFNKNIFIYCFPLIFVFIGFFINDNLNLFLYEQTGFIYGSLVSWIIIFYYVTFFSYKSLTTSKKRDKLIATEILYFFTIILLTVVIHFSSQFKQNSDDRFVISTISANEENKCFPTNVKNFSDCQFPNDSEGWVNCDQKIVKYEHNRNINKIKIIVDDIRDENKNGNINFFVGGSIYYDSEMKRFAEQQGVDYSSYLLKLQQQAPCFSRLKYVTVAKTTEYVYDYQIPLIDFYQTYFISFLFNLLIIGYLWRAIFSLVFWSLRTLYKS